MYLFIPDMAGPTGAWHLSQSLRPRYQLTNRSPAETGEAYDSRLYRRRSRDNGFIGHCDLVGQEQEKTRHKLFPKRSSTYINKMIQKNQQKESNPNYTNGGSERDDRPMQHRHSGEFGKRANTAPCLLDDLQVRAPTLQNRARSAPGSNLPWKLDPRQGRSERKTMSAEHVPSRIIHIKTGQCHVATASHDQKQKRPHWHRPHTVHYTNVMRSIMKDGRLPSAKDLMIDRDILEWRLQHYEDHIRSNSKMSNKESTVGFKTDVDRDDPGYSDSVKLENNKNSNKEVKYSELLKYYVHPERPSRDLVDRDVSLYQRLLLDCVTKERPPTDEPITIKTAHGKSQPLWTHKEPKKVAPKLFLGSTRDYEQTKKETLEPKPCNSGTGYVHICKPLSLTTRESSRPSTRAKSRSSRSSSVHEMNERSTPHPEFATQRDGQKPQRATRSDTSLDSNDERILEEGVMKALVPGSPRGPPNSISGEDLDWAISAHERRLLVAMELQLSRPVESEDGHSD